MKAEQCTLDTLVKLVGNTLPLQCGKVAGPVTQHPTAGEVVVVEWESGLIQKVTIRSLLTEEEATLKEAEMAAKQEQLEQEWQTTSADIKKKIEKAAKLIDEANGLARKEGNELLDLYDETRPLMRALDRAGWSTSSMVGC